MRILMLDNEFPPLGGGTGVVNLHLLREFAEVDGLWVDLVTSSRTADQWEEEQFAPRIRLYKVPVDNHNIHHARNIELLRYAWRGYRQCCRLQDRQAYDFSFAFAGVPAGVMSYALKRRCRLPYVLSLQGPDVPWFERRYDYLYPFLIPVLRRVWREAAAVTSISSEFERLAQRTLPGLQTRVIFNGVDAEAFSPEERQGGPEADLHILCVGRLIERKGQQHLLRAFARLRENCPGQELRLVLAGTGDAEAELKALAAELGLGAQVTFAGFVSRQEMPGLYRQADIFVLPSQQEGMSIALLEALAAGLPVVVSDTGGTQELVTAGENGLVTAWGDVEGLEQALRELAQDAGKRQRLGTASRRRAMDFTWAAAARRHLELFQSLGLGR